MRSNIIDVVRRSAHDQDRDPAICDVLLVFEILIYRNQYVEFSLCEGKQFTILLAAEPRLSCCFARVPASREQELHLPR